MSDTTTPETAAALPASESTPSAGRDAPRRGAVLFVVVFLLSTFVLLALNRAAINSSFMNWYLFHVASHTAWVLDIVGEHGKVEDPDLYKDRIATVRASIREWQGFKSEPGEAPDPAAEQKPLTSYEVWTYRALRLRNDLRREEEQIKQTDPLPRPEVKSIDDQLRHVSGNLDRVERAMQRSSRSGPIQVTVPEITEAVNAARTELASLESADPTRAGRQQALDALERRVDEIRLAQRAFLEERSRKISLQISDRTGPTVDFLMKTGLDSELARAQKQLDSIQTEASLSVEQRAAQAQPVQAVVSQLTERRKQTPEAKENKDIRFRFNVVPDCGALSSMAIFLAAMLAFPTHMWKRLAGLMIGIPILYGVNIVRLSCLAVIGAYTDAGELFVFAHEYVWQGIYILFVVAVWLLWVEFLVKPRGKKAEDRSPKAGEENLKSPT